MLTWVWKCFKHVLFLFDAESVHHFTVRVLRWCARKRPSVLVQISASKDSSKDRNLTASGTRVWNMPFLNPIGLAAGFDKDAELLEAISKMGFGFAEIGTVTPRPQPGNPRPRLFRDTARESLFNRMGFNSKGAQVVAENFRRAKPGLPKDFRVGVNVGKNKETSLDSAASDYVAALKPFQGLPDYVVVNVSSPNTPGLRELQSAEKIRPILEQTRNELERWPSRPPLLLKIAPELSLEDLKDLVPKAENWGVEGWIVTNTLGGLWRDGIAGGWSGAVLTEASRSLLTTLRPLTRNPIISVGGILDTEEAHERVKQGASLVQVYTGWIYKGPAFAAQLARSFSAKA